MCVCKTALSACPKMHFSLSHCSCGVWRLTAGVWRVPELAFSDGGGWVGGEGWRRALCIPVMFRRGPIDLFDEYGLMKWWFQCKHE